MKQFILILAIATASCCSSKPNNASTTSGKEAQGPDAAEQVRNPVCIDKLIADFQAAKVENPPRKIYSYTYKGNTVYYVPAICCDFYSDLYDNNCTLIGHPDGGFTGKGDGKITDFETARSNERLIWQDKRK